MDKIEIHPTTSSHIRELGNNIRDADRKEIESFGFSMRKGLWRCFRQGINNKTALLDGKVVACWGVGGVFLGDTGQPWFLTTKELLKMSKMELVRIYKREVEEMLTLFPVLENYVDSDYNGAVRLLRIAGFTVGEPEPQGQGMYRKFTLRV